MSNIRIIEILSTTSFIDDFLTPIPLVGPGAVISKNLEWSIKFDEGKIALHERDYLVAEQIFHDLDKLLPSHEFVLTPAKINESFCWLHMNDYDKYIMKYEKLLKQDRVVGAVLWNLVYAYYKKINIRLAESCLKKWISSPTQEYLIIAFLVLSIFQKINNNEYEAKQNFDLVWDNNTEACRKILKKYIKGSELESLLQPIKAITTPIKTKEIVAKEEVITELEKLLIPRQPDRYTQLIQQLSPFEYQSGYISALERFGDGDIDEALKILDSLISGRKDADALLWAKSACLLAQRQYQESAKLIGEPWLTPTVPGGVLWNAACAYFNIKNYSNALRAITACTDREFRSSFLAHLGIAHKLIPV